MPTETPDRPNVLLICTDHWSGLLTRPAGHPVVITPTLEQLARNGVTFTQAYSACPSCVPARRTLMTGMTARSHGDRNYTNRNPMPDALTMAQCFRNGGYQAYAVGKLHVHPQRDRIGFDEVILDEQGRHQFGGGADDYELFLTDQGFPGQEYASGMCHNDFIARPWHLPEHCHPVNWAVREISRAIRRRDPRKPGFWYLSFSAPHPPLVPLQAYLDLYRDLKIDPPSTGNWSSNIENLPYPLKFRNVNTSVMVGAPDQEQELARRAFYATLTHIDHQIRLVIGLLQEEGILNNTIVLFTSDHGHMIGEHGLWCMTPFYEMSAKIPLILMPHANDTRFTMGSQNHDLAEFGDLMPTLLDMCDLPIPSTVDGIVLGRDRRDYIYGEHYENERAMRMIRADQFKLIYYACGNRAQLFDLKNDPRETNDLASDPAYTSDLSRLKTLLVQNLYGSDEAWIKKGDLIGLPEKPYIPRVNRGLMGQRGLRFM